MQIYTKILIGMAVGAIVGLTLGPNSTLLEKDLYKVADGRAVELRLEREDADSRLRLPRGVPLELRHVETVEGALPDSQGETHTVPAWVKVRFRLNERLLLRDEGGKLQAQLGNKKLGQSVEAWLRITAEPLDAGGFTLAPMPVSALGYSIVTWAQPVGKLFMRLIQMVIVPLVFASLLVGVASLGDVRKLGRLGGKTLGLYMLTTAVAVTIGLVVAHLFQPGSFIAEADRAALLAQFGSAAEGKTEAAAMAPSAMDNVLAIIPLNPIESLASGNMLQIIFFAVVLGVALTMLGEGEGKPVVNFFDRIQNAMIVVIHMVMAIAPYGVAALVAEVVGTSGFSVLKALVVYGLVVVAGLLMQALLVYGGLVKVLARMPLLRFLKAIRPAQLIAFSTSSSSAALPVSMECAEENLGVSNSVSSFVLPLGSTVNMDGTALYQGVAAIFIAQVFQMDLSLGDQLSIVLAATMASVGAAGVPGAGMVTLAMVLTAAGIPQVGLALILGMDRLLDMFRTAVNVTGDLAVTSVMAVSEGENLDPLSPEADRADPDRGFEGRLDHDPKPVEPD
jgi:proton glutamate symport protein